MASKPCGLLLAVALAVAACAPGDTTPPTAAPPITLAPPPAVVFDGECAQTPALDAWLQSTATFLLPEFTTTLTDAASKSATQVYDSVLRMARLRDAASDRPTPDCAAGLQLLLLDAMNTAVDSFQAYANGEAVSISETTAGVMAQLEQVTVLQNELISRLDAQYSAQRGQ